MKIRFILILINCLVFSGALYAQQWKSIVTGTSPEKSEGLDIIVYENKLYFGGIYEDQVNIGFNSAIGINNNDIFLGKAGLTGFTEWLLPINGTAIDRLNNIEVVGDEIIVSGQFSDSLFVGTDTLVNDYQNGAFIAYFDTLGNYLRVWEPEVFNAKFSDFAFDSNGDLMITGEFYQHFVYGGFSMTVNAGLNFFLMKYSPSLDSVLWGVYSQGNANYGICLSIDQDDNTYTTGAYNDGTYFIDTLINTGNTNHNMYVNKIDTDGNQLWITTLEGTGEVHGYAVVCDDSSNVFATGEFEGVMDAQGTLLTSHGFYDAVILKYDPTGTLQWAEQIGSTDTDEGYDLEIDENMDPIVLCEAGVDPDYRGQTLYTHGFNEPLLLKIKNGDGSLIWDKRLHSTITSGVVNATKISKNGDYIAISGINRTSIEFNSNTYNAPNNKDFYFSLMQDSLTYYLGLENEELVEVNESNVYPNPFQENFTIQSNCLIEEIEIFDLRGIQVKSIMVNSKSIILDLENQVPGVYVVRVSHAQKLETHKVLKVK